MTITFDALFDAAARLASRQQVPFVAYPLTHLGGGDKPGQDKTGRYYTMRQQTALAAHSDALLALTNTEANFYRQQNRRPGEIKVISPGVDPDEIAGGKADRFMDEHGLSGPFILCIGAMSREKGTIQLVEAIRRLWSAGRQVELVLVGETLTAFRHYMNSLPPAVRQRIRLLGPLEEVKKRDALAAAAILSLTSITESFGTVYLEAWLYGLPVIGADCWAVRDVITDGQDGLLVPFGDDSALAQALSTLLDDPEKAREMGRKGKQKVLQHHTWTRQFQVVHDLYRSLVT
jgi:glycosyltransferase involved in cell wall biosynthesis